MAVTNEILMAENEKQRGNPCGIIFRSKVDYAFSEISDGIRRNVICSRRYCFSEARRNTKAKHKKWEKYYNRHRRDVQIKVHEQMSRFGGLSEERPSVFKTRSKLGTHLSTQCTGDERQSRPCAAR
ncbi:hypothetical protein TNCV_4496641 [Trichonephila clavipes]|nr:hypothetical protein TNCV_4496641 [Trichonephila clavipes]